MYVSQLVQRSLVVQIQNWFTSAVFQFFSFGPTPTPIFRKSKTILFAFSDICDYFFLLLLSFLQLKSNFNTIRVSFKGNTVVF